MKEIPIGPDWEAIGPFPSGMREHPFMGSPLHAFADAGKADADVAFAFAEYGNLSIPTPYVAGGVASWARFTSKDGQVAISFDGDWEQLRADHGWASCQYRAELRSTVVIPNTGESLARVRVDAITAAEYAFVRKGDDRVVWYTGDVYAFADSPDGIRGKGEPDSPRASNFARCLALPPGEYVLLVRALYEVRMFGDPGSAPPNIRIKMRVFLDADEEDDMPVPGMPNPMDRMYMRMGTQPASLPSRATLEEGISVVPDLRDGWFMGSWMSVGVRVPLALTDDTHFITVTAASEFDGVRLATVQPERIAPGQMRAVPLKITQTAAIHDSQRLSIKLTFSIANDPVLVTADWEIPLRRRDENQPFRLSFASPSTSGDRPPALISLAMVVPPPKDGEEMEGDPPVLLALHGAGVDTQSEFWVTAMPRICGMWSILPSGRNEWGEDWHGGSMADVWAARSALAAPLHRLGVKISNETLLVGHSNGGQGAWHLAARYPSLIRGVVAIAGYVKIQDYVPYTELTSHNYADPALMGILLSSHSPYNNDLYASNLASVPVLAVHGGKDDNVPPRHGRAHVGLIRAWTHDGPGANVQYVEVKGEGHWWDGILQHPSIMKFIKTLPPSKSAEDVRDVGFTLTTANPDETGFKGGLRILEVIMPGRLARLDVNAPQWRKPGEGLSLYSTNVRRIEMIGSTEKVDVRVKRNGQWETETQPSASRAYGPMIRLLASDGVVTIVVPDTPPASTSPSTPHSTLWSLAQRYAHDLYTYHRLDAAIVLASEALRSVADETLSLGSVVVLGRPKENKFTQWLALQGRTPVRFPTQSTLSVDGRVVWEKGSGIISLHPHPTNPRGLAVLVAGNDLRGFELAARLLPLRTGVPVPDWVVVTPRCTWQAAGGIAGAGFWGPEWGWSEVCWMDRERS